MSFYLVVSLLCIAFGNQVHSQDAAALNKPIRICPAIACRCLYSQTQYFLNVNGCRHCRCRPYNPCAAALCPVGTTCQVVNGKAVCQCNPLPFACVYCPNGYVTDANGCRTCQCRTIECPLRKCVPCPNGYVVDSNGCQTCECIKTVTECPVLALACIACTNGYLTDANGCSTCRCAPGPVPLEQAV